MRVTKPILYLSMYLIRLQLFCALFVVFMKEFDFNFYYNYYRIARMKEAGLLKKWSSDYTSLYKGQYRKRRTEKDDINSEEEDDGTAKAFTLTQLQGPFAILIIGFAVATISFMIEKLVMK